MKMLLKCAEIVIALTRSISSPYNSDRERCTHLSYKLHIYIYIYIYVYIIPASNCTRVLCVSQKTVVKWYPSDAGIPTLSS